jgi:hypothetical protein
MKTAFRILLALTLAGWIGCTGAPRPSTPVPGPGPRTALNLLRQDEPGTRWDPASLVHGDLDQDGTQDFALSGIRGDRFVVGIVQGPVGPGSRHWTLEFPWDGTQDALCSRQAKIELEELEEEGGPTRHALGINLHDDRCDAFHISWDADKKTYDWWRL